MISAGKNKCLDVFFVQATDVQIIAASDVQLVTVPVTEVRIVPKRIRGVVYVDHEVIRINIGVQKQYSPYL